MMELLDATFSLEFELIFAIVMFLFWILINRMMWRVTRWASKAPPNVIDNSTSQRELLLIAGRQHKIERMNSILAAMKSNGAVDTNVLVSLFRVLMARRLIQECLDIYESYKSLCNDDIRVHRIILACSVEQRRHDQTLEAFSQIGPRADHRDWHVRMRGCRSAPDPSADAFSVLKQMEASSSFPSVANYHFVFQLCVAEGKLRMAEDLLCHLSDDIAPYNSLMRAYVSAERYNLDDVRRVFDIARKLSHPTHVTYGTMLHACVNADQLVATKEFVKEMTESGIQLNVVHQTTLIKGLCKAKKVDDALELFETVHDPDLVTYSTIIKALADCMRMKEVFELLDRLEKIPGLELDEIVYNSVLFGCVHIGDVARAHDTFERMQRVGVNPSAATISTMLKLHIKMSMWDDAMALLARLHKFNIEPEPRLFRQVVLGLCRRRQGRRVLEVYNLFRMCTMKKYRGSIPMQSNGEMISACIHFNLTDTARDLIQVMADTHQLVNILELDSIIEFFQRRPPRQNHNESMDDLLSQIELIRRRTLAAEKMENRKSIGISKNYPKTSIY